MKKLLVLAALLTVGAYSANAQTGTSTTTTRQTTTTPMTPEQTTPATTTTTESTTTSDNNQTMTADTKGKGKTLIQPAPGTKVKGNGKRIKIK